MHFFQALILGIVEGITEFLPISSTGHLVLVSSILHVAQTDFAKSFEIIIQLGAILSVVVLYWRRFLNWTVLKKVIVAFLPTAVIGLVLYKFLKQYLLGNNQVVLWALLLGGIVIIAFELTHKERIDATDEISRISYKQALAIGLFQAIAIIPGVSRSAATILGGLMMNIKRRTIVEFSFLLAVPTMAAASALDLLKNYNQIFSGSIGLLAVGFIVSFIVAILSIKYFLKYIQTHSFRSFGVYRIVVAIFFWLFV